MEQDIAQFDELGEGKKADVVSKLEDEMQALEEPSSDEAGAEA